MTTPTAAEAVRAAINGPWRATDVAGEQIVAIGIRVAADALLPRPATGDQSSQAVLYRLLALQFLELANTLAGNPAPAATQEALAEAREESQAAAIRPTPPPVPTPSAPVLPPAIAYGGGGGVRIEAANRERTLWAIRRFGECFNTGWEWEYELSPPDRSADFLARTRWPSAEAAWEALLAYRAANAANGVQS
jgi:hypothetical protein